MLKTCFSVLLILLACFNLADASDCGCKQKKNKHTREAAKHRSPPNHLNPVRSITIEEMIKVWDISNAEFAKEPTHTYPREDTLFQLTGFLHRAKLSDDDCDYHLELAASTKHSAPHIIVEIANGTAFCDLRRKFLDAVIGREKMKNRKTLKVQSVGTDFVIFKDPPKITVVGYGFLDTAHWSSKDHKLGNKKHGSEYVKSLWEIHPVFDVMVE